MKTMRQIMIALMLLVSMEGFATSPTISGFSPISGPVGILVTITGTNLSSPTAFSIGGVSAVVVSNTGTSLVGMVMPGATTGSVSVTTAGGSASSSSSFAITSTHYPVTQQGSKLVGTGATNGAAAQGTSVAISADGNTAIVGGSIANSDTGAVWIYVRTGSTWTQQGNKLVGTGAVNSLNGIYQGYSVALSADGNTALVGGYNDNNLIGAAWVFIRSGSTWTQQGNKLVGTGATGAAGASFGYSVALSADGNTAIMGGINDDNQTGAPLGAAWVFTRSGAIWTQQGNKLVGTGAANAPIGVEQGYSVALSADGNTAIVGGRGDSSYAGAAWVYTRSGTTWTQQGPKLVGTGANGAAMQGSSVSLSADGNTAIVGGYQDNSNIGAAWVYTRSGSTWTQQGLKLEGTGLIGSSYQGFSVSLSADGNTAIVGGEGDNSFVGGAWVYTRSGSSWTQQGNKIVGTGAVGSSHQGASVSLSADGTTATVGGWGDNTNTGAMWVFVDSALIPSAGPDQTICQNATTTMTATGTGTWAALSSNPAVTTITNPLSPTTAISGFTASGQYGFVWAPGDTTYVTVKPAPPTPTLSQIGVCLGADSLSLSGVSGIVQIDWYHNGILIDTTPFPSYTIAGGNGAGGAADQFDFPTAICLDGSGNLYVADYYNDRIQKFPAGSTSATNGVTVAANGLNGTTGIYVDGSGNIYAAEASGASILEFPAGSTSTTNGLIVAGGNGYGSLANQLANPDAVYLDNNGNIYVSDAQNYRIQKFPAGSTSASNGVTVAGGNGQGSAANQLGSPGGIYVDGSGNIYIADYSNNRIQKFPSGSTSATNGVTVASNGLNGPTAVYLDGSGNIYVADERNNRIQKFPSGSTSATTGVTVAGGNGAGIGINQLSRPNSVIVDGSGNIYISDANNFRVQEWTSSRIDSIYTPAIAGSYTATILGDNGCQSFVSDTVIVVSCTSDTVWPGDADDNKLVDNRDLLTIGLGYDSIGPVRTVTGNVWQPDLATDWSHDFTIYLPTVNYVHADCDGNGTINADDTAAIALNWGDTHAKTSNLPGPWRSGIPALSLSFSQDTALNNDTLTVGIILGSNSVPVNNIYGLAFTFNYDPLVIDSNYSIFAFNSSWLGTASNSININRNSTTIGQVKAAITGIDHIARSGNGQIATFTAVITTGNINGKDWLYYHNLNYISDITAIDQYGNPVQLNAGIDSDYVGYFISGIKPLSAPTMVNVYPNPAATQVRISADADISEIRIIDIIGEIIQTVNINGKKTATLDISQLAAGVYTVRVSAADGTATAKLVVSR